jgi:hypothetical protein
LLLEVDKFLMDGLSEDEYLQVLADLHGGGDTKNELIVLEYEQIKQQVYFEYTEGDKSYFNLLKASKFAQLALEAHSSSYARYESVDVVTAQAVLLRRSVMCHKAP